MAKMTKQEFIDKAKKILGEDKYSFVQTSYYSAHTQTIISCKKHGDFLVEPANVLYHHSGCPLCKGDKISKSKTSNTEEFISKAKKIHKDENYDYSLVDYKSSSIKVKIICPVHGIFEMTPNNFLRGENCPLCHIIKNKKQ